MKMIILNLQVHDEYLATVNCDTAQTNLFYKLYNQIIYKTKSGHHIFLFGITYLIYFNFMNLEKFKCHFLNDVS